MARRRYIKFLLRCNYCGADHLFPAGSSTFWKEENVERYLMEHLIECPGNADLVLPPHIEIIDPETGDLITHMEHFTRLQIIEREDWQ